MMSKRKTFFSLLFLVLPLCAAALTIQGGSRSLIASSVSEKLPVTSSKGLLGEEKYAVESLRGESKIPLFVAAGRELFQTKLKEIEALKPGFMIDLPPDFYRQFHQNRAPVYPRVARQLGYEGKVEVEAVIDREGNVIEVFALRSSGYVLLDEAALKAVKNWSFQGADPSSAENRRRIQIPVIFSLD